MKEIFTMKIDRILSVGIDLSEVGVSNWALDYKQSLSVLEQFLKLNIAVYGGDVYVLRNGELESNYDNWFCEELENELDNAFVDRSIEKALVYINNYPNVNLDEVFFILVPKLYL